MKRTIILKSPEQFTAVLKALDSIPTDTLHEVVIRPHRDTRTLKQNNKMWAMLDDVSEQVIWYGNYLTQDEWKDFFTAALKRQKVIPGMDGGFVVLGTSTSKMKIADMADMIELMYAFGAEHEVRWSDPTDIINYDHIADIGKKV